jgi:hypothetical protein
MPYEGNTGGRRRRCEAGTAGSCLRDEPGRNEAGRVETVVATID